MFEAMGGKNSMPKWVDANPPLAFKDYTHFNGTGAKKIAEMFTDALISESKK
jgi:lysophospholipase L1-like esterase